jgi:hypothetical protein
MMNLDTFFEMFLIDTQGSYVTLEVDHRINAFNENHFIGTLPHSCEPAGMQLVISMNCGDKCANVVSCEMPAPPDPAMCESAVPYITHTEKTAFDGGTVTTSYMLRTTGDDCTWTTSFFQVTFWPFANTVFGSTYQDYSEKYKEYGHALYTRAACKADLRRLTEEKARLTHQLQMNKARVEFVEGEMAKEEETVDASTAIVHEAIGKLQVVVVAAAAAAATSA